MDGFEDVVVVDIFDLLWNCIFSGLMLFGEYFEGYDINWVELMLVEEGDFVMIW